MGVVGGFIALVLPQAKRSDPRRLKPPPNPLMFIVCSQSGTVLYAKHCYLLENNQTTDEFFNTDEFSDSEVAEYAKKFGTKLTPRSVKLPGEF